MWSKTLSALLALCLGCAGGPSPSGVPPAILGPDGQPARVVDLRLQGVDDARFRLSAHRGEAVVVAYVTTWSIPAGVMLRHLTPLVRGPSAVVGLKVVAVALDKHPEAMLPPFIEHSDLGFSVYPAPSAARAGRTPFGELPGVPCLFLVDPAGRHVETVVGVVETESVARWARAVLKGSR